MSKVNTASSFNPYTEGEDDGYHQVLTRESNVLEDEREFGDYDAGDWERRRQDVDAGKVHPNTNRDAGTTVSFQYSPEEATYGTARPENDDAPAPEDDDERFGEALPDDLGGREGPSYPKDPPGGPVDTTQSQAIFPGSDEM